ncbi:MAG: hypothetical protein ACTSRU_13750 [Candidatus Hodarchaeales archaeon]
MGKKKKIETQNPIKTETATIAGTVKVKERMGSGLEKPTMKEKILKGTGYGFISSRSSESRSLKIGDKWTLISPRGKIKVQIKKSDLDIDNLPKGIIFSEIMKEDK